MSSRSFAKIWRRIRTVPGLGLHVASLVIFVALAVAVTATMIAQSNAAPPFSDRQQVLVEFAEVPGVTTRSSQIVTIAGVEVGQIVDAQPTENNTAVLTLDIEGEHTIYDNARAVLRAVNPLNQMFVELNPGGAPGQPLAEGAVIPVGQTSRPIQVDEVLDDFDAQAQAAITDLLSQSDVALARAPQEFPAGINATTTTLVNLQPALAALDTRREKLSLLVTSIGQIAQAAGGNQERALRLADATEQALGVLAANDEQLRATIDELPGLYRGLDRSLTATRSLTDELDPVLESLRKVSGDLPDTLDKVAETSETLGDVAGQATPVIAAARPLVSDFRPLADHAKAALADVLPITEAFDRNTALIVDYTTELQAFVYNTASVFGVRDARSGIIRGHVVAPLPDGSFVPAENNGYVPTPQENGLPPVEGTN